MMPQSLYTQVWLNRALINNESEVINALIKPSFTNTPLSYNQILIWTILSNKVWSNLHTSDIIIHLEFPRNARRWEWENVILFWHFFLRLFLHRVVSNIFSTKSVEVSLKKIRTINKRNWKIPPLEGPREKNNLLTLMRLNYMIVVDLLWFIEKSSSSWHDPADNLSSEISFSSSALFLLKFSFYDAFLWSAIKKMLRDHSLNAPYLLYILLLSLAWLPLFLTLFSLTPKKNCLRKKI